MQLNNAKVHPVAQTANDNDISNLNDSYANHKYPQRPLTVQLYQASQTAQECLQEDIRGARGVIFKRNWINLQKVVKPYLGFSPFDRIQHVTQILLKEQGKVHRQNELFKLIIQNDLNGLKSFLKKHNDKKIIEDTIDPVGSNCILTAYLYQKYEIGRWLVENYSEQALLPYSDHEAVNELYRNNEAIQSLHIKSGEMPYTGENILHILIVQKNIVELRWLLEFYESHKYSVEYGLLILLNTRVSGTFFAEEGGFYCGNYPLHFAVGSNSPELFDIIFAYYYLSSTTSKDTKTHHTETYTYESNQHNRYKGRAYEYREEFLKQNQTTIKLGNNAIFIRDRYGNNCLHLCVIHQLDNMFTHIKEKAKNILKREIKQAYFDFDKSTMNRTTLINIRPLPAWDVVELSLQQQINNKLRHSMTPTPQLYNDVNTSTTTINNTTASMGINTTAHQSGTFNIYLEDFFEHYIPGYNIFSSTRLEKAARDSYVTRKDIDNGFYFGYSLRETPIFAPTDSEKGPISQEALSAWIDRMVKIKLEERFEWVLNEKFHSPLTCAITKGMEVDCDLRDLSRDEQQKEEKQIVNFVLDQYKSHRWDYGPVTSSLLYLEGVDLPYNVRRYGAKFKPQPTHPSVDTNGVSNSRSATTATTPAANGAQIECADLTVLSNRPSSTAAAASLRPGTATISNKLLNKQTAHVVPVCTSKPLPKYAQGEMFGLVEWICIQNAQQTIKIPEISKIVESKWINLGFPAFVLFHVWWSILCVLTTFIVCYSSLVPKIKPNNQGDWLITILFAIAMMIVVVIGIIEIPAMIRFGFDYFGITGRKIRGAAMFSKILMSVTVILYFVLCSYKFQEYKYTRYENPNYDPHSEDFRNQSWYTGSRQCEVLVVITVWMKMFYFLMGYSQTGPFVLVITNVMGGNVPYFMMFYLVILVAYSAALSTLTMDFNTDAEFGVDSLLAGIYDLIQVTVQQGLPSNSRFNIENVPSELNDMYNFLLTSFYFIAILMFTNLLIGMIGNTFNKYSDSADALLLIEKYNIMCGLDMSVWWLTAFRSPEVRILKYAIIESIHDNSDVNGPSTPSTRSKSMYVNLWASLSGKRLTKLNSDKKISAIVPTTECVHSNNYNEAKYAEEELGTVVKREIALESYHSDEHSCHLKEGSKEHSGKSSAPLLSNHDRKNSSANAVHLSVQKLTQNVAENVEVITKNVADNVNKVVSYMQGDGELPLYAFEIIERKAKWWQNGTKDEISEAAIIDSSTSCGSNTSKPNNNSSNMQLHNKRMTKFGELKESIALLILDPQNDFHEAYSYAGSGTPAVKVEFTDVGTPAGVTPIIRKSGSLGVPKAIDDSNRIAKLIIDNLDKFDSIIVTMDSHQLTHIAHHIFWTTGDGYTALNEKKYPTMYNEKTHMRHPKLFTVITHDDVLNGIWKPVDEDMLDWAVYYTKELENKGKFKLTIWPNHCILGTNGHAVVDVINDAILKWCKHHNKTVTYVMKGQNLKTEMYSVLAAEVEDPDDPETAFNEQLMSKLQLYDKLVVCGQARSHVVKFTMEDILKHYLLGNHRLFLLEDGCSSVSKYEKVGTEFLDAMRSKSVNVVKCDSLFENR